MLPAGMRRAACLQSLLLITIRERYEQRRSCCAQDQRFQFIRDQLAKEGITMGLPTGN
jgi:hypothetical protein